MKKPIVFVTKLLIPLPKLLSLRLLLPLNVLNVTGVSEKVTLKIIALRSEMQESRHENLVPSAKEPNKLWRLHLLSSFL
jgi:hypothetical protein